MGLTNPKAYLAFASLLASYTLIKGSAPQDSFTKVYGSADPMLTYRATGFQFTDTAASVLSGHLTRDSGENVGSYAVKQGTLSSNSSNYTISFAPGTLSITPAPLAVTADDQTMIVGAPVPSLTYHYTGLVHGDTSATFTGTLATTATSTSPVNNYPITQGSLAATGNYAITAFTGGTLHVTSVPLTFLKTDTATQGSWQGVYGTDGYALAQGASSLPAYAQVAPSGQGNYTWNPASSDVRALQQPGASARLAACWYASGSFTLDVNPTDGQTHVVALYLLDWDNLAGGRREQIDVLDATNSVLSSTTVAGFNGGEYLVWSVGGHVRFRLTNLGGGSSNAVASALFFGQAGVKADAATQGSWQGTYGTSGYTLAPQGPTSLPSYATVNVAGGLPYTWAASTTDPRALQKPGASDRLAAAWYAPGSFTIDVNLTDGQSHPVALYLLDWDNAGRSERVDVLDQNNDVLYSSTVTGFSGGQWLEWTLAGHDTLRVTSLAGPNAVASGLFFGQTGAPQLAAGGPGPGGQGLTPLTEPELTPLLAAAEDRLIASGLSAAEAQELRHVTAVVTRVNALQMLGMPRSCAK